MVIVTRIHGRLDRPAMNNPTPPVRRVIRYQTSSNHTNYHPLDARRWRRKRKVAAAKQSIRRSRGGPPPSPRIRRWRRWRSGRRLKVTRATREKGFTTPARLFMPVLYPKRMLVTGFETLARHAGLRDDFFRTMTGNSPSARMRWRSPRIPVSDTPSQSLRNDTLSRWCFSGPTRRQPEAAGVRTCRSTGAPTRHGNVKTKILKNSITWRPIYMQFT